jgi:hypothetical protein
MSTLEKEYERLRQYLNPAIRGKNTDNILRSLASGPVHLINNVEAVYDNLYIVKAVGEYLDQLLASRGLTRPDNVGLSDDVFREIGIEVVNRKQVRDLIGKILDIVYGSEFTKATISSTKFETYQLEDGDTLKMIFDDGDEFEVVFSASRFTNIGAATAQEVADAITRYLRKLGSKGSAQAKDDGNGFYVMIMSNTIGPSSSVKITGGKAQNKLQFPKVRPTGGEATTQWTLTVQSGSTVRATWSGGPNPSLGKVKEGDYINIYGTSFSLNNRGTFTITKAKGGLVTEAYVEYSNINGVAETKLQGTSEGILFFQPARYNLNSKTSYAALYQTESRILEIFMPATTKVVRRDRIGSAHVQDAGTDNGDYGPYIFDSAKPYIISEVECNTTAELSSDVLAISVDDAKNFPDESGYLVFGFGTSNEEGPVPYLSRPSDNILMVNPVYRFKKSHNIGTNISLVAQNHAYEVETNGSDYAFYITDIVSGRVYAEDLINSIAATGISVVIYIMFPNDIGLSKYGTVNSEKTYIWGEDPV